MMRMKCTLFMNNKLGKEQSFSSLTEFISIAVSSYLFAVLSEVLLATMARSYRGFTHIDPLPRVNALGVGTLAS